jgi:hypothetical protein
MGRQIQVAKIRYRGSLDCLIPAFMPARDCTLRVLERPVKVTERVRYAVGVNGARSLEPSVIFPRQYRARNSDVQISVAEEPPLRLDLRDEEMKGTANVRVTEACDIRPHLGKQARGEVGVANFA